MRVALANEGAYNIVRDRYVTKSTEKEAGMSAASCLLQWRTSPALATLFRNRNHQTRSFASSFSARRNVHWGFATSEVQRFSPATLFLVHSNHTTSYMNSCPWFHNMSFSTGISFCRIFSNCIFVIGNI
jgi:hypothetical protein